jgi:hypothetical protein
MNAIAQRFFNTLIQTLSTPSDAKSLREHIGEVNAKHFGNTQKANKLFMYFADLMGTRNANTLAKALNEKFGSCDTSLPLQERVSMMLVSAGFKPKSAQNWMDMEYDAHKIKAGGFNFPLVALRTSREGEQEQYCYLSCSLYVDITLEPFSRVACVANLVMHNHEGDVYNLPDGWDISESCGGLSDLLGIYKDKKGNGLKLNGFKASDELLAICPAKPDIEREDQFWLFASGVMLQHVTGALSGLNANESNVIGIPDGNPIGGFFDMNSHTFFQVEYKLQDVE